MVAYSLVVLCAGGGSGVVSVGGLLFVCGAKAQSGVEAVVLSDQVQCLAVRYSGFLLELLGLFLQAVGAWAGGLVHRHASFGMVIASSSAASATSEAWSMRTAKWRMSMKRAALALLSRVVTGSGTRPALRARAKLSSLRLRK